MKSTTHYLLALGVAGAAALFLVLAIGALGIIGDGGRDDRIYAAVLVVLVIGTVVARLRPAGMTLVLLATAATQALVTVIALAGGVPADASVVDILGINAMYVALFCLAAGLFRRVGEQQRDPVGG